MTTSTNPTPARSDGPLARWARFAIRNPWRVIAVWVVLAVIVGIGGTRLGGEYVTNFTVPNSETQDAVDLLAERFPAAAGDTASLVFQETAGITSPAAQPGIQVILAEAATLPGVLAVTSPFDVPTQVSSDGTIAFATLQYADAAIDIPAADIDALTAFVAAAGTGTLQVELGGQVATAGSVPEIGGVAEVIGIGLAIVIMLVMFGSAIASAIPILSALVGVGLAVLIAPLFANVFTMSADVTLAFLAMMGLGVGIDYALFIVNRFRDGVLAGQSAEDAGVTAMDTAGRSVAFAGVVVAIGLLGLATIGIPFVTGLGVTGAIAVGMSVLVAIFLMPAVFGLTGTRILRWRIPGLGRNAPGETGFWFRWGRAMQAGPGIISAVVAVALLVVAIPFLDMRFGLPDAGSNSESSTDRRAYDLLAEGFGPGTNGPLLIVLENASGLDQAAIATLPATIQQTSDVAAVTPPVPNANGDTAIMQVIPQSGPQDDATTDLINDLRGETLPAALAGSGTTSYVAGATAAAIDVSGVISDRMPVFFLVVIGLSVILLAIVFRSLVIPVKTAILNLLSVGAAFGAMVAIFQWGWLAGPLGIESTGPIVAFLPMILFGVLFGLSMDYEVFLLSRVHEEVVHGTPARRAMLLGVGYSGKVVAAAGAIMAAVFFGFFLEDLNVIKQIGFGLAFAVAIDAFLVRLVLVPTVMTLLGERAWYLPGWLDRILPRVSIEGPSVDNDTDDGVPAPDRPVAEPARHLSGQS